MSDSTPVTLHFGNSEKSRVLKEDLEGLEGLRLKAYGPVGTDSLVVVEGEGKGVYSGDAAIRDHFNL